MRKSGGTNRIPCLNLSRAILATLALVGSAALAGAQEAPTRQAQDDAWWTGPMLAPSATTLPRGHFLIEPYLYDVTVQGFFDAKGVRHGSAYSDGFGSLTYINYGVADKLTAGIIPVAGYNRVSSGPSSSGIGLGDLTLQVQYRLAKFHEGGWIPTISVNLQETLPTGKYDRLRNRPSDGFGAGAYTTTFGLYAQTYFWLPNGRILRMRFNVTDAISNTVKVSDMSVYGTEAGFRGHAEPGRIFYLNPSWEYSLTRSWVLALDATYRHAGSTRVTGYSILDRGSAPNPPSIRLDSGTSGAFALAPAIEYSWTRNVGVLLGVRLIPAGHNTAATISPAIAINYVH
jgi:hypothetical protein